MAPRGTGHIVNVSSTLGKAGLPGGATYAATKFGIVGFCESVKGEIEDSGIDLTIVMPGVVETALGEGVRAPIGIRLVQPEDVAEAIVDALEKPRYEVYVPFEAGPIAMLGAALPQGMRDTVAKAMGLNRTLTGADAEARAAYEDKVRSSE
jgi:short-subunit dehydrogenase